MHQQSETGMENAAARTWVAMPAWSVPGSQSVGRPRMRWKRAMMSCSVTNMAWPMCRRPVTFGGGMAAGKHKAARQQGWRSQNNRVALP